MKLSENTLGLLQGARVFSKLDANSGFWQILLSEESKSLTTFISPFGRFCFNRLPFGISSAPEHFLKQFSSILNGIDRAVCHMDDVLVWGSNREEHDKKLRKVLQRLQETGVTLNHQKCSFQVEEITFLGHKIDRQGIRPDDAKTKAVREMCPPTSKPELQRMLGMATYLARFVPNLADVLQPLSSMLSSKQEFVWGQANRQPLKSGRASCHHSLSSASTIPHQRVWSLQMHPLMDWEQYCDKSENMGRSKLLLMHQGS